MKSAVSSTWIYGLVITFILVFAGYLAFTINYSTAFKVKNEMITIIEKHKGMTNSIGNKVNSIIVSGESVTANVGALQTINLYLLGKAYDVQDTCPTDHDYKWAGVKVLDTKNASEMIDNPAVEGKKYYYCFYSPTGTRFYKVRLFYRLDLPVLGDFFTFSVDGTTSEIFGMNTSAIRTASHS